VGDFDKKIIPEVVIGVKEILIKAYSTRWSYRLIIV